MGTVIMQRAMSLLIVLGCYQFVHGVTHHVPRGLTIGGSTFYCNYDKGTYDEAHRRCRSQGRRLAMPKEDPNAIDNIRSHCTYKGSAEPYSINWYRSSPEVFWLGAHRERHSNYFTWNDGEVVKDEFYMPGEPNNVKGIQDCLVGINGLDDDACDLAKFYVCQDL